MKAESSVDALIGALKDQNSIVRREAARALGNIKPVATVPGLIPALILALLDKTKGVKSLAAWALGEIKPEASVPRLVPSL